MAMLRPHISEQFKGVIWRLEIDEKDEIIFAEIRDSADKQVQFASASLKTGEIYFKGLTMPERWLTGIEAAYKGVLLLHNYQSPSGPLHKGIVAVNGISGEILWSNYIYAFDHLTVKGPILYDTHIHPKRLFLADIKTGVTNRVYEPTVYPALLSNIITPQVMPAELLPLKLSPLIPFGNSIHYLEYNKYRIVSLHNLQAGRLKQHLFVMDGGDKIYEDLLNADIQKLQPEAFILHKNRLIYIKNKSELKVLNL